MVGDSDGKVVGIADGIRVGFFVENFVGLIKSGTLVGSSDGDDVEGAAVGVSVS